MLYGCNPGRSAQAVSSEEDIAADLAPNGPPEGTPEVGLAQRYSGPPAHPWSPGVERQQSHPSFERLGRLGGGGHLKDVAGQRLCRHGVGEEADRLAGYNRARPCPLEGD